MSGFGSITPMAGHFHRVGSVTAVFANPLSLHLFKNTLKGSGGATLPQWVGPRVSAGRNLIRRLLGNQNRIDHVDHTVRGDDVSGGHSCIVDFYAICPVDMDA